MSAFLEVVGLHKSFGGVAATDHVDLAVAEGEVHAVIGPNGAGKTTLIAQLAGALAPDRGRILFRGRDITHLPAHARSHLGLARSFQITSLIEDMSVRDNVALAVQSHAGHSFRFWRPAREDPALTGPAMAALARVGLDARADLPCRALSHGEHRQLELAEALDNEHQQARGMTVEVNDPVAGPIRQVGIGPKFSDTPGSVRSTATEAPERLALGSKFSMSMKLGVPYKITNEVVEFEEPSLIAWQHMGKHIWRYRLRAVEGGTEVTEEFDFRPARSATALKLSGAPKRNAKSIEATLDRLVAHFQTD